MQKLNEVANRIIEDFPYFCRICLTIPARDWKVPPDKSTIKDLPFVLSEHQIEYVKYLESELSDKTILKTRQRGYSVVTLAFVLWKILYGYNENIIYAIDNGDKAKDMAGLIRRMYDSIPKPFKPTGIVFRSQPDRVNNHRMNNKLVLKTATANLARGGTFTMTILDEFAAYDENIQLEIAASITSSCPNNRVWISTPRRENDSYHNKVKAAKANDTLWKHDYWDWIDDWFGSKEMAEQWRPEQEKGLTPTQIARELDCKFKGAVEDTIWYVEPSMFRTYRGNKNQRAIVALDLGYEDPTAILFAKDYGNVLHVFDEAVVEEKTIPQVAGVIRNRGYRLKYGVCDSSGKKTDQTSGISSWKNLERLLQCRFRTKKFPDKIEMLRIANRELLFKRVFIDPDYCPFLVECLNNYEWENDRIPHNKYSHIHDSFVYLVYNWLKFPNRTESVKFRDRRDLGISY